MTSEDEFLLKWHDHHQSFFLLVEELVMREQLTDVTLACGDANSHQLLSAHSLMLSVCSPYFRTLLSENRHKEKHHIIHLHGVSSRHMQQLLLYMYRGEISISQEDLGPLIETARCLQIKGLSMATPNVPLSTPKKRTYSAMTGGISEPPISVPRRKGGNYGSSGVRQKRPSSSLSPVEGEVYPLALTTKELSQPNPHKDDSRNDDEAEKEGDFHASKMEGDMGPDYINFQGKAHTSPLSSNVSLPILPKPLSILKTAETRTFLSKLIWLGNGGRRPQYGNPETKPCWWPQHILPWEEMKKMGGRKSVELTHINYTEILKQCLAAGYEYFGYDPLTYHAVGGMEDSGCYPMGGMDDSNCYVMGDSSIMMEEEEVLEIDEDIEDKKQREPVLEIDLDQVENCKAKNVRSSDQVQDILCK